MIKRLILFLLLPLFVITCGAFSWYYYAHRSLIPTYEKKLSTIADTRFQEISEYLINQEKYAVQLSQNKSLLNVFEKNASPTLLQTVNSYKESMDFKNILLTDKNGTIIFSTTKKNLVGINLSEHTNSSLGKSYERAKMTLTTDFSSFNFNELLQEPALFITIPLLKDKKYIGTFTYQLDEEKIYRLTNQYIGLGKTGEVVLGKKESEYIVFLSPTRNDPDLAFKRKPLFSTPPLAMQPSILGQEGSGSAIDYRGKMIIGAWKFIPKLDWGMIVKIDLDEIMQSTLIMYKIFLLLFFLFIFVCIITIVAFWRRIHHSFKSIYSSINIPPLLKNPLFILLVMVSLLAIKNILVCREKKYSSVEKTLSQAIENNTKNSEHITKTLEKIAFIGQSIAKDLHTNYLKKDDIKTRIMRDLAENSMISDITVAYEPFGYDEKTKFYIQSTTTTDIADSAHIFETNWYRNALEKNNAWTINSPISSVSAPTCVYSCSFFDAKNKPIGVIAITFSLSNISNGLESNGIGKTGYSFITTQNGTFIFHPISSLVTDHTTLLQFAQEKGNEELASIAEKVLTNDMFTASYKSAASYETHWITTKTIAPNHWIIGTIFSENEVSISPKKIRHYYFWILLWIMLALLLCASLCYTYAYISEIFYAGIINLILLLAMIAAWYAITITHTIDRDAITMITDQSNLDKFLNDLNEEADRKHEPKPINIPCGLLLYSLNIPDPDHIEISGYLWTKYSTKDHKDIARGIDIVHSTRMAIGKPLSSISGDWETETWTTQGILAQDQQNKDYPFDQQKLRIILEHRDIEKNIILTPDLQGYKKISPESTPGLDKNFVISGFTVEQTFFEYKNSDPKANFGFKEYGKVTDHFQLIYNVVLHRNLLNPFVLYILPLLVILFSLFCTLLIASRKTDPFSMLGPYTGLFFSLIVLQRSLREQHPSGTTLYIEYAFFYTYLTIILLIIHTILNHFYKHKTEYQNKIFHLIKFLFWPFQLITWFITTLVLFY